MSSCILGTTNWTAQKYKNSQRELKHYKPSIAHVPFINTLLSNHPTIWESMIDHKSSVLKHSHQLLSLC